MDRATIEDVARRAGVSVATVSRALRDLPNVARETKRKVEEAAAELGYRPHAAASWLASGKTSTIGIAAPWFHIWYTGTVLAGIQQVLGAAGFDLTVYGAGDVEQRKRFLERAPSLPTRIDGLILIDFYLDAAERSGMLASGLPVVSIGEALPGVPSVGIDNRAAAEMGANHLIDRGHTRIAIAGTESRLAHRSPVLAQRHDGYRTAMEKAGLPIDPTLEYGGPLATGHGPAAIKELMGLSSPPTAILFMSDEMAIGAMGGARTAGIDVPGDVSVIGFDDHDLAAPVGLTTVAQPIRRIGEAAARLALDAIGGSVDEDERRELPCQLVERTTVSTAH